MTHLDRAQNLLANAAEPALVQIKKDRGTAPPKLRPLLAYLEENLFDSGLNVAQLMLACSVRDNSLSIEFGAAIGQGPRAYIEEHRLQTAVRLLTKTDLKIWQVGELIGYSSLSIFSRAFDRWSGSRPGTFRRRHRQTAAAVAPSQDPLHSAQLWRQAMSGGLELDQAGRLIDRLQALYPNQAGAAGEEALAERVWRALDNRMFDEQQAIVSRQVVFTSSALFELLLQKSRVAGRQDRQRGVEVAELALASVAGSGHARADLVARAWAWIGNARRLALDFYGADQAFAEARATWASPERDLDNHQAEAELPMFEGALRLNQRRFDEASELNSRAIEACRRYGLGEALVQALLLRATAHSFADNLGACAADAQEAISRIDSEVSPYLKLSAYSTLINSQIESGELSQAQRSLQEADALAAATDSRTAPLHLRWIEAEILRARGAWSKAEDLLLTVRSGFKEQAETYLATMASLDLALLYTHQGNSSQVIRLSQEILPVLEAYRIIPEALASYRLLQTALERERVNSAILQQVQSTLRSASGL